MVEKNQISVCIRNKVAGTLKKVSAAELEFSYSESYLKEKTSLPLSLSIPLDQEVFSSKISMPFFHAIMGDIDACFKGGVAPVGAISFGDPLPDKHTLYKLIDLETIPFSTPLKQNVDDPVVCLKDRQPIAHLALIGNDFYRADHPLLQTHCVKSEICLDDGGREMPQDLVANEIFLTLIAFNLGIPVPTIQRCLLDEVTQTYALIVDRPDRYAPNTPSALPVFRPSETFATALIAFGEVTFGKMRVVDIDRPSRQEVGPFFDMLRQYSSRPALDFRVLLRTIFLCLMGGADDFELGQQFIAIDSDSCRLLQMRDFLCTDIYPDTRKKFLFDVFNISSFKYLKAAHFEKLSQQIQVNEKYLRSFALEQALFIPKIAREILQEYPTLETKTTLKILQLIEKRALKIHDLLVPSEARGTVLNKVIG